MLQDAITLFENRLKRNPKEYLSHCGLGRAKVVLYELNNKSDDATLDSAITHYDNAIASEDNWALAYYQKACAFMRYKFIDDDKKNKALAALLKAIFINRSRSPGKTYLTTT